MHQPNNDVEFATVHLATGPRLHYAEQGDPAREAIVFLHAYADSWFSYGRVLPLLSPEYHALAAFMEAVGIEKATLVGDSSGGMIAQLVALDYSHRVRRLVLIGSPTTLVSSEAVTEWWELVRTLEDPIPPQFVRGLLESIVHRPVPEEFLERAVSESLKVPACVWRDYWEGVVLTVDDTARLGEIGTPTLILWGEQDTLLPREEQEWRAAAIPNATLRVYRETGHLAHWVRPEWVVRDLEEFLRETPGV